MILATHRIVRVDLTEGAADDMAPLAMYVDSGVLEGVYERDDDRIRGHIRALKPSASARVIESIMLTLRQSAPKLPRTNDRTWSRYAMESSTTVSRPWFRSVRTGSSSRR